MIEEIEVGGDIPVAPTLDSEREASPDFQTAFLVGKDGETVEVIYIGEIDAGRHLLVAPHQAWHRQSSKRKFTGLSKPLQLEVACCSVDAREEMLDQPMMKVWMGLVTDQVISALRVVMDKDARDALNYTFGVEGDPGFLPHVLALAHLAQEQFSFVSAESALEGERPDVAPLPTVGGSGQAGDSLQTRVSHLETSLNVIQATLDKLVERTAPTSERRVTLTFAPKPKIIPASPKSSTSLKLYESKEPYTDFKAFIISVPFIGPRRGGSSNQCGGGTSSSGGHAEDDEFRPEWITQASGVGSTPIGCCTTSTGWSRSSFGVGRRSRRRWIAQWCLGHLPVFVGQADGDPIPADVGEDSKSKSLQGGSSLGFHIWWSSWRSQCRRGRFEASGCSSTCSSSSPTRSSRGHQLPSGAFDAGRLDQHCATSRSSTYHPVGKGVDRAQESHWLLTVRGLQEEFWTT